MKDIVSIEVNGNEYFGWKDVRLQSSLKNAVRYFEIGVSEQWKSYGKGFEIHPGDECLIRIDGELVLTGYIDLYKVNLSPKSHDVTISGRSQTCDIVDCSAIHVPGNFFGLTLDQIALELTAPYDVHVIAGENIEFAPIEKFELNQGETPFQAVERLARKERTLVTDDHLGNLILTNASEQRYDIQIDKYLEAVATKDYSSRYSLYKTKGQQHGPDFGNPLEAAQVFAEVNDAEIKRFRPLIVRSEGNTTPAEAERRAIFQRNRSIGESINVSMSIDGFHNIKGELWEPNKLIWVSDEILGIEHELLLHTVTFEKSESGSISHLEFSLKTAFELPPANERIGAKQ
ncbi:MAG: phage baseplate assembly protein [Arenicella sp.]